MLSSGAVIGSASTFEAAGGAKMATFMADWRAGASGYLGFRFTNPTTNQVNDGYALSNTAATGRFPMTIVRYWYSSASNAITTL